MIEFPRPEPEPGDDPGSTDPDDPEAAAAGGPGPDADAAEATGTDPGGPQPGADPRVSAPIPPPAPGMAPEAVRSRRRRLARLGDGIARLSAHITAATARLLAMIRAFDEAEGWHEEGFRSCALDHRDGGCRFPGCGSRFCDAHHIVPWAEGGIDEWTPATSWDGVAMDVDWALYTLMEPLPPRTPRQPGDARQPEETTEPGDSQPPGRENFPNR